MTSILGRSSGFVSGAGGSGPVERIRRILQYRKIMMLLIGRDLKVRYAGSALGYVWSILDPLLMSLVYWFIFTRVFAGRHLGGSPYIVFLIVGQFPFFWINNVISTGVGALRSEAQMVRSSNVPRELWVLRLVLSKGVEYLLSLPVVALFCLAYLKRPNHYVVLLPLAMVLTVVFLTGVGLILAPLGVLVPDVRRIMRVLTRVMFYLSPVLYSINRVPKELQTLLSWNPIAGILCLYRAMFFPEELAWTYVARSAVISVLLLVIGAVMFARLERPVLKEI